MGDWDESHSDLYPGPGWIVAAPRPEFPAPVDHAIGGVCLGLVVVALMMALWGVHRGAVARVCVGAGAVLSVLMIVLGVLAKFATIKYVDAQAAAWGYGSLYVSLLVLIAAAVTVWVALGKGLARHT